VAIPAILVGVWMLARAGKNAPGVIGALAIGAALPAAIVAAYHTACFGAPWKTGYSFIARPEFAAGHASGLLGVHFPSFEGVFGLLVGERRGLFFISPVAFVGVVLGLRAARRSTDGTAYMAFACAAALLWLNAGYYMWWGGAAAGPRHLVPALGCVAFGLAAAWSVRPLQRITAVLAVVSLANCLTLAAVGLEAPETGNVLTDYAYRFLLEGKIAHMSGASNLGIELGLAPAGTLGPVLAWIFLGARLLWRRLQHESSVEQTYVRSDTVTALRGGSPCSRPPSRSRHWTLPASGTKPCIEKPFRPSRNRQRRSRTPLLFQRPRIRRLRRSSGIRTERRW
jgi:hypothetical protein